MVGDPHRDAVMFTFQVVTDPGGSRYHPGYRAGPARPWTGKIEFIDIDVGIQLFDICSDDYQPFLPGAMLQFQQVLDCLVVTWVATQAIDRFRRVGNDPAGVQAEFCLSDQCPVQDTLSRLIARWPISVR
jgi:hypothetical protein